MKTLEQAIETWLSTYPNASTKTAYSHALARFLKVAKLDTLVKVRDFRPKDMPAVGRELGAQFKPASVAQAVIAVRSFYKFLAAENDEFKDPTTEFKAPAIGDNVPEWNVLHQGDPAKLAAAIKDPRDRAVVLALLLQGWRVSAFCNLTWKQIRKEAGRTIVEYRGKRNKLRTQTIQQPVLDAALAWAGKRTNPKDPFVCREGETFSAKFGARPLDRFLVYRIVRKYAAELGFRVTPHGLRATYISSAIDRKGIEAARQLAGQENLSTTQRYSRWKIDADDPLTVEDL